MEIALELMHFEMRFRKLYSGRGIMLKLLLAFEVDRIFGTLCLHRCRLLYFTLS